MNSLDRYYVGELCLSQKKEGIMTLKKLTLLKNGAIDLQNGLNKGKLCDRVFTVFLEKDGKYYCLHDGKAYFASGDDFCTNLIPIKRILPVIGYRYTWNNMSTEQTKCLFDLLFKRGLFLRQDHLFDKQKRLDINRLYVGNVRLYTGYNPEDLEKRQYEYSGLVAKLLLRKSDAKLIETDNASADFHYINNGSYEHQIYNSIFLDYSKKGMYNLHNFCFYGPHPMENEFGDLQDSYYEDLVPMQEKLEENHIYYADDLVSVPKALSLYRRLRK